MTQADRLYAEKLERSARSKKQADDLLAPHNWGRKYRAWIITQAIIDAFDEGVQFEREAQAIRQGEGRLAGRG